MKSKPGYVIVLGILMVVVASIIAIAVITQVDTTIRRAILTRDKLNDEADALKIIATSAAYLRSKYSVANGFYLAEHRTVQEHYDEIKNVVLKSSGPVEKTVWESLFQSDSQIYLSVVKDLLRSPSGDTPLQRALRDSKQKGLISADLSKIKVLTLAEADTRTWSVLLFVQVNNSFCWAVVGPEGFFNYAVFLPNGIPEGTYYGTGEVIDGPSWFGVDDRDRGGLGILGNPGPRFYGKTFYRKLRKNSTEDLSRIFVGGRVTLSDSDVQSYKRAFQGKTYWEAQLASLEKVDLINFAKGDISAPNGPAGIEVVYSKASGAQNIDDLIITSTIETINGVVTQVLSIGGPEDGYFRARNNRYKARIEIPFPGPPNVPAKILLEEKRPNGQVFSYNRILNSFNGFLGLFCETTNSQIAFGHKDSWIKNTFIGDWTILAMGYRGRQEEQTPHDYVKIYSDIEYYSAKSDRKMVLQINNVQYEVQMTPFFTNGRPIPNNRDVKGLVRAQSDGAQTLVEVDGKTFWDAWYKTMSEVGSKDHINFITAGDIVIPWHQGYRYDSNKIRNLRMDMSIFTMYWDREKAKRSGNPLVPTLKVDYRNFQGLSYRFIFGSLASEAVTATWSTRENKGLKEFNVFDQRLYSAKRGFAPMTGAILMEGLRLR